MDSSGLGARMEKEVATEVRIKSCEIPTTPVKNCARSLGGGFPKEKKIKVVSGSLSVVGVVGTKKTSLLHLKLSKLSQKISPKHHSFT